MQMNESEKPEIKMTSFTEFKLNKQVLSAIEAAGFERPTAIQQQAIPRILAG